MKNDIYFFKNNEKSNKGFLDKKKNKNNFSNNINFFFSSKYTFTKENNYVVLKINSKTEGLSTKWFSLGSTNENIVNGLKKITIDKLMVKRGENLTPVEKTTKKKSFATTINKLSDIELKYRIVNYTTMEGYNWFGEVWYNNFSKKITKVNYLSKSEDSIFYYCNEDTRFEEGVFLKVNKELIAINTIWKGKKCNVILPFISKSEQLVDNTLPIKNFDIRDE